MNELFDDAPSAEGCYDRGRLLQRGHRYADAAEWYRRGLLLNPEHAPSHAMLAMCWTHTPGKETEGVAEARRAVALDPLESFYRCILAMALLSVARDGQKSVMTEAAQEAAEAVKLDAQSSLAHAVEAQAYLSLKKFPEAEAAARKALALDTEDAMAAEALSIALLQQHKDEDASALVRYQLQNNPQDSSAHTSAGWSALMRGHVTQANEHFLEALRLHPMSEGARQGLVECYRARSVIYRSYVRFSHAMTRFSERGRGGILIGGFIAYRLVYGQLSRSYPVAAGVLAFIWVTFVLWSHLARGIGAFFMVFDSMARRALRPREFWEGVVVGGLVTLAIAFLGKLLWSHHQADQLASLLLFISAVPAAGAFSNHHYWGQWLYTGAAVVAGSCALYFASGVLADAMLPGIWMALQVGMIVGVAMTWIRGLGFAHD